MKNNFFDSIYLLSTETRLEFSSLHQYINEFPKGMKDTNLYALYLANGLIKSHQPVNLAYSSGRYPKDIMTADVVMYVVSGKFIKVLKDNQFTGWSTFAVKPHDKRGEEIKGYKGLAVTGRCGKIDNSKSKWVKRKAIIGDAMVRVRYGYYFDPKSWDGSDIFLAEGTGVVFVVKKVKEALENAKISNVEFIKNTEFERMW